MKNSLSSFSISDDDTLATISKVFKEFNYILDPHGAVGYLSLEKYLEYHPTKRGFFLETAHPVKFPDAVEKAVGKEINIPASISSMMKLEKKSIKMHASFEAFRNFLLD